MSRSNPVQHNVGQYVFQHVNSLYSGGLMSFEHFPDSNDTGLLLFSGGIGDEQLCELVLRFVYEYG